ncbi:MAG: FecR domain-containing protein [Chitinophagaceae bacterium]|nr:FecR domain-containing protein [Chitinophagaceae bacterium]
MRGKKDVEVYKDFIAEDFAQDDYFIQSVRITDKETVAFWAFFLAQYPEKSHELEKARMMVELIQFREHKLPPLKKEIIWQKISSAIDQKRSRGSQVIGGMFFKYKSAAAVIGVLILSSIFYYFSQTNHSVYAAGEGEFKEVILPDGSRVNLSSRSQLKLHKDFKDAANREVWLEGEGYFSISPRINKDSIKSTFVVHTKDLDVEVLGTTFNVNTRHEATTVVLNTGKINVKFMEKSLKEEFLKPGDKLTFTEKLEKVEIDSVNAMDYISWKDQKFIFDNTSVKEIAQKIEDYYGYKVWISDSSLANREISGILTVEGAPKLIDVLSTLLNIEIEQRKDSLFFRERLSRTTNKTVEK